MAASTTYLARMEQKQDAVGTQPDPGAKPKKKPHAPTVIAVLGLSAIIIVAALLVVTKWL
jgi:hypothetical protein